MRVGHAASHGAWTVREKEKEKKRERERETPRAHTAHQLKRHRVEEAFAPDVPTISHATPPKSLPK